MLHFLVLLLEDGTGLSRLTFKVSTRGHLLVALGLLLRREDIVLLIFRVGVYNDVILIAVCNFGLGLRPPRVSDLTSRILLLAL